MIRFRDLIAIQSLTNALNDLRDDSTPELIRAVVPTALQFIDLTTPSQFPCPPSISPSLNNALSSRFTRLSTLLSSSILGTVIMYTPAILPPDPVPAPNTFADPEHAESDSESITLNLMQTTPHPTLVAAADVLPLVIAALGIGAARFLKGIVPVVTGWLALPISSATSPSSVVGGNIGMVTATSGKDKPLQGDQSGPLALHFAALHIIIPRSLGYMYATNRAVGCHYHRCDGTMLGWLHGCDQCRYSTSRYGNTSKLPTGYCSQTLQ